MDAFVQDLHAIWQDMVAFIYFDTLTGTDQIYPRGGEGMRRLEISSWQSEISIMKEPRISIEPIVRMNLRKIPGLSHGLPSRGCSRLSRLSTTTLQVM